MITIRQGFILINQGLHDTRFFNIDLADILIGATAVSYNIPAVSYNIPAVSYNIPIATLNTKHFDRIEGLEIIK